MDNKEKVTIQRLWYKSFSNSNLAQVLSALNGTYSKDTKGQVKVVENQLCTLWQAVGSGNTTISIPSSTYNYYADLITDDLNGSILRSAVYIQSSKTQITISYSKRWMVQGLIIKCQGDNL